MSCTCLRRLNSRCFGHVHAYGPGWPMPSHCSGEFYVPRRSRSATAGDNVANGRLHASKGDNNLISIVQNSSHLFAGTKVLHARDCVPLVEVADREWPRKPAGDGNLLEQTLVTPFSGQNTIKYRVQVPPSFPDGTWAA